MNRVPAPLPRQNNSINGTGLLAAFLVIAGLSGCGVPASDAAANQDDDERIYRLEYRVTPDPADMGAHVELSVTQPSRYLREISMPLRDGQISQVSGDGNVELGADRVVWTVPESGGKLRWFALLNNKRDNDTYDSYIDRDWALFRGMDIIPSARTRVLVRAESRTTLRFDLPDGWSSVTPYFGRDDVYEIHNAERRFVTPTGWMVLGDIGVRNDTIGHVRVKVAGPTGHAIRRLDMLALLRWNLPELLRLLPDFPERLTFVSAGAPMWRGALSAPNSYYVHAERPLISENATATMLHEAVHVGLGVVAENGADWVIEGIAEYYSLQMLRRSGSISQDRFKDAMDAMQSRGRRVEQLCTDRSTGRNTALAVTILAEVNREIREVSNQAASLDDVLVALADHEGKITVEGFRDIVTDVAGQPLDSLRLSKLPGCG